MANVTTAMQGLIAVFMSHANDCTTLSELDELIQDHTRWRTAHDLFQRVRKKTLVAHRTGNQLLETQYQFEEVCAKTLYNLSGEPAPFDTYVPFSIAPNAFALARQLSINDSEIVRAITS